MKRWDIINRFVKERGYISYLEIGIGNRVCFNKIKCCVKVGIDLPITSDQFFKDNKQQFDIIFIDGDHREEQVIRDIINSRECCTGVIVIHDCLPPSKWFQRPLNDGGEWCGTVWKAVLRCFNTITDYCYILDTDWGCGVIDTTIRCKHAKIDLPDTLDYDQHFHLLRSYVQA